MLSDRYDIYRAKVEEAEEIMKFINQHWRENHIISKNKKMFLYEFLDNDGINFIIARNKKTGELEAILGYLKSSKDPEKKDIWGSFWKNNSTDDNGRMLGLELQHRLKELSSCRYHNGIGINPKTAMPLVRLFLGNKVGKMKQYYLINDKKREFLIAKLNKLDINFASNYNNIYDDVYMYRIYDMNELNKIFNIEDKKRIPYKDKWYFEKKYFNHPLRKYEVYAVINEKKCVSVIVCREEKIKSAKALRIIDYYGELENIRFLGGVLRKKLDEGDYEYVDFYEYGINDKYFQEAGFVERNENVIIPNYFQPFIQENIDIWIHYEKEGTIFFKGDGDQDRPN